MGSCSSSDPSVEELLTKIQHAMDRLKLQSEDQGKLLLSKAASGDKSWALLNKDLRTLREELSASKDSMVDFKDEVYAQIKDVANTHGDFGNPICTLELAVSKLLAILDSK